MLLSCTRSGVNGSAVSVQLTKMEARILGCELGVDGVTFIRSGDILSMSVKKSSGIKGSPISKGSYDWQFRKNNEFDLPLFNCFKPDQVVKNGTIHFKIDKLPDFKPRVTPKYIREQTMGEFEKLVGEVGTTSPDVLNEPVEVHTMHPDHFQNSESELHRFQMRDLVREINRRVAADDSMSVGVNNNRVQIILRQVFE